MYLYYDRKDIFEIPIAGMVQNRLAHYQQTLYLRHIPGTHTNENPSTWGISTPCLYNHKCHNLDW
jgi:hypothetical protein